MNILLENQALTRGSQKVFNDKKLMAALADTIRDDSAINPSAFPAGFKQRAQKAPDEELAKWFLENIDKIEKEGYEGTVYSRDGVNSEWIARRYIAGSHNWEDLTGVMNMNLRDWYILKNRNLLEPQHSDIPKFKGVRDIGYYMNSHYRNELQDVRDAAKKAALRKMQKSVKLVDNDDYRIYTTLNRAAACALGLGTQWCTANSQYGGHFHTYSDRAMLFQIFPYKKDKDGQNIVDDEGKKEINNDEKYQFDAGGYSFMNQFDRPADPKLIKEKYPYIFRDLSAALKENKPKLEQAFKDMSADPTLQSDDYRIKTYEIDEEIKKLEKFINKGYFTDKKRPSPQPSPTEQPSAELAAQPQLQPPTNQGQIMEEIDKDVAAMLNSLKRYDMLAESKKIKEAKKPDFLDVDKDSDKKEPWTKAEKDKEAKEDGKEEVKEGADVEVLTWMKRFNALKW